MSLHLKSDSVNGYESFGGFYEERFINILKSFYNQGNTNLPESKRHRKPKDYNNESIIKKEEEN